MKIKRGYFFKQNRGFALIVTVGVLCVLTLVALSLNIASRLEEKNAANFNYALKAKYLAEAGINMAIAGLKSKARSDFIWSVNDTGSGDTDWYDGYSNSTLMSGYGAYSVNVTDCSSQIYVNGDNTNNRLRDMLNILGGNIGGDCDGDEGTKIINNRPSVGYETKEQLRIALSEDEYNAIKDYITVHTYVNTSFNRAPINVNTAKQVVLKTVLEGIPGISDSEAATATTAIISERPFSDWSDFDACIDGTSLSASDKQLIKDNCNPNGDKSGFTQQTTEFCFHAGGCFEIQSTGDYYDLSSNKVASVVLDTTVKIFDVVYKGSKSDFMGNEGDTLPIAWKVNAFDNCPVRGDQQGSYDSGGYDTISGSLKIGFWDDFDEDGSNALFYVNNAWRKRGTGSSDGDVWSTGATYSITDADLDGDNELQVQSCAISDADAESGNWKTRNEVVWLESSSPASGSAMDWRDFSYSIYIDDVSYTNSRSPTAQWYVGYPAYRYSLSSGIKDEFTWWPPLHFTSQERWKPGCIPFTTIDPNKYWNIKKRVKFVLDGTSCKYYLDNESWDLDQSFRSDTVGGLSSGAIGFWGWYVSSRIDNIRIIPKSPDSNGDYAHFTSEVIDPGGDCNVSYIQGTVTIPSSANSSTEKIYFQVSNDGGSSWTPASPGLETGGSLNLSASSGFQWKANFTIDNSASYSGDEKFRETPVLEDVTVIYIVDTEILYFREQ